MSDCACRNAARALSTNNRCANDWLAVAVTDKRGAINVRNDKQCGRSYVEQRSTNQGLVAQPPLQPPIPKHVDSVNNGQSCYSGVGPLGLL